MQLTKHEGPSSDWATLIAGGSPFIRGNSVDAVSWECPCGRSLAVGLDRRQILNVLIECAECGVVLESPLRQPGEPIPGQPLYLSPGARYLIGGEIDVVDKPVAMVGHAAIAGYIRETGRVAPGFSEPLTKVTGDLVESISHASDTIRAILGTDHEKLEKADALGRASKTPPRSRHRLIELLEFAEAAAQTLQQAETGTTSIDANLLTELMTVQACATRWRNHPAWASLRQALISETLHTTMLLAVASYLVDANNGVGIHVNPTEQNATTADIWLEPDLKRRLDIEIKTPLALRAPRSVLTEPDAVRIVTKALKKSGRQRRATRSNLLIIGGYHLGLSHQTVLATAKAMLILERRRWRSLAGIMVVDCTYEARVNDQAQEFTPVIRTDVALHPAFEGDIPIGRDADPTAPWNTPEQ